MNRQFLRDTLLPLLVFPTLSCLALKYTYGHIYVSGLADYLLSQCPVSGSPPKNLPYALAYTSIPSLDTIICTFVAFGQEAMAEGNPRTFFQYFISVSPILVLIPAIEGFRTNRSIFIAFPVLFGLLSQVLTWGAAIPLYWLAFFLSGGRTRFETALPITKAHAEAVIFGLVIGAFIPSLSMFMLRDPTVTAIWQLHPIYFSISALLHLIFRTPRQYPQSGFAIIQVLHLVVFMVASSAHFSVLWTRRNDISALMALLIPTSNPLVNAGAPTQTMNLLKWDFTFAFLSTGIAQLWFVSDLVEIPFILFWYVVAVPFFGPGAAVVAVNLWREGQIGDRVAIAKEKQS